MAKADRLERMDERRVELEAEYRDALIAALRSTAEGTWGLFGHNVDRSSRAVAAPILERLQELADTIDAIRARFAMEPFPLHPEFMATRGRVGPSAPGEPKQALQWLQKLGTTLDPDA